MGFHVIGLFAWPHWVLISCCCRNLSVRLHMAACLAHCVPSEKPTRGPRLGGLPFASKICHRTSAPKQAAHKPCIPATQPWCALTETTTGRAQVAWTICQILGLDCSQLTAATSGENPKYTVPLPTMRGTGTN